MSPIVARVAARNVVRVAERRQFSLLRAMRDVGRSMEAHPFERLPTSQKIASPDYSKMVKRVGSQAVYFFPGMALILGWPYLSMLAYDGRM